MSNYVPGLIIPSSFKSALMKKAPSETENVTLPFLVKEMLYICTTIDYSSEFD